MKRTFIRMILVAAVTLAATTAIAEVYEIDGDHTTVGFKVKHLGISSVSGSFTDLKGTVEYDPKDVANAKTEAHIVSNSIDTRQKKRDDHLRSPEFLNTGKFPELSFKSKKVTPVDDKNFLVDGDLTIAGITKPVQLKAEFGGLALDPWGSERVAFNATTKINRKEFGITWNKLLETGGLVVGEDVDIILEIEAKRSLKPVVG